jgi:hypothetical protein
MPRERLPQRRCNENIAFRHWGVSFQASVGRYGTPMAPGRIGEVFLSAGKLTSDTDTAAKEAAIALSFALQYGATIEEIRGAMPRRTDGSPEGPLGALLDILAKSRGGE